MLIKNRPVNNIKTLLFDLDGTLLDTAPDLAGALYAVLREENLPLPEYAEVRRVASDGALGLLTLGMRQYFHEDLRGHPRYAQWREKFLAHYAEHVADETRLFSGMGEVLNYLDHHAIPWGVVTNKPERLTCLVLAKLGLKKRAACIIAGDTLPEKKPHPAPLLHAAKLIRFAPEECGYVGDAPRDIEAAKAAHMTSIAALYGYWHSTEEAHAVGADMLIAEPRELLRLF